jgi:hypothetical protein
MSIRHGAWVFAVPRYLPRELSSCVVCFRFLSFARGLLWGVTEFRMPLPRWADPADLSQLNIS